MSKEEKIPDFVQRYSQEISDIAYILKNLENGRYYENTGAKMDGSIPHNVQNLRKLFAELLIKVDGNLSSETEEMMEALGGDDNK